MVCYLSRMLRKILSYPPVCPLKPANDPNCLTIHFPQHHSIPLKPPGQQDHKMTLLLHRKILSQTAQFENGYRQWSSRDYQGRLRRSGTPVCPPSNRMRHTPECSPC